jgi:hypothetical protein
MRLLIAVCLVGLLSACGTAIESASEEQVSIRYLNLADSPDSLRPMAEEHCASYQRDAVYRGTSLGEGTLGFLTALPLHAEFDCRVRQVF